MALPPHRQTARPVGAHPERHLIGIAVDDVDVLDRDAQLIGHHLRESGLVPLAVAVAAHEHAQPCRWAGTRTTALSNRPARAPSEPTTADGAMPHASM